LADRSPNRNRHVFHEVMSEVSARLDSEVQSGIARERGQHVIEKAMPRGHIRFSASARHFNANLCFRRLPNDHAHGSNSLSITKYTWETLGTQVQDRTLPRLAAASWASGESSDRAIAVGRKLSKLSLLALKLVPELHRALQRPAPLNCRSSDAAFLQGGTQFRVNARQLIAQESVGGIFGQDGFAGLRRLANSLDAGRSLTRVD